MAYNENRRSLADAHVATYLGEAARSDPDVLINTQHLRYPRDIGRVVQAAWGDPFSFGNPNATGAPVSLVSTLAGSRHDSMLAHTRSACWEVNPNESELRAVIAYTRNSSSSIAVRPHQTDATLAAAHASLTASLAVPQLTYAVMTLPPLSPTAFLSCVPGDPVYAVTRRLSCAYPSTTPRFDEGPPAARVPIALLSPYDPPCIDIERGLLSYSKCQGAVTHHGAHAGACPRCSLINVNDPHAMRLDRAGWNVLQMLERRGPYNVLLMLHPNGDAPAPSHVLDTLYSDPVAESGPESIDLIAGFTNRALYAYAEALWATLPHGLASSTAWTTWHRANHFDPQTDSTVLSMHLLHLGGLPTDGFPQYADMDYARPDEPSELIITSLIGDGGLLHIPKTAPSLRGLMRRGVVLRAIELGLHRAIRRRELPNAITRRALRRAVDAIREVALGLKRQFIASIQAGVAAATSEDFSAVEKGEAIIIFLKDGVLAPDMDRIVNAYNAGFEPDDVIGMHAAAPSMDRLSLLSFILRQNTSIPPCLV